MTKYKGRYRIETTRLKRWDYRNPSAYFVTICTGGRKKYFGKIKDKKIVLSRIGEIARKYWIEIPEHFPFVKNDIFTIVPNHIHGIIIITEKVDEYRKRQNLRKNNKPKNHVETLHATSLQTPVENNFISKISPKSGSLSVIIRSYKSAVTNTARKINKNFSLKPRFYEHIIRDENDFLKISKYILENHIRWEEDEHYL